MKHAGRASEPTHTPQYQLLKPVTPLLSTPILSNNNQPLFSLLKLSKPMEDFYQFIWAKLITIARKKDLKCTRE